MSELQERVQQLITILEHMRKRPGMYIRLNTDSLFAFLQGLSIGMSGSGIKPANDASDKIYYQVLQEHGWTEGGTNHVSYQMGEKGYPVEKIIDETLLINIETLKRRYNVPDPSEKQD